MNVIVAIGDGRRIMATVELTFDQVMQAVRALPDRDRRRLLNEVAAKQHKRMSELLAKGNAGTLTADESRELDQLVADFERRTAAMAEELAASCGTGGADRGDD